MPTRYSRVVIAMVACGGLAACGSRSETGAEARAAHQAAGVAVDAVSGATSHQTGRGAGHGLSRFDHVAHQLLGAACEACHHPGSFERSCASGPGCHSSKSQTPLSSEAAFHRACQPCHRESGLSDGCQLCHSPNVPTVIRE